MITTREKSELSALLSEYRIRQARANFVDFVREAWHIVEPGIEYVHGWHVDAIATHLESVYAGKIRNLLVNVPPRHSKSTLLCVMYPAWVWLRNPGFKFIFASHSYSLSKRDSIKCRLLVQSEWYRRTFNIYWTLSEDQNEKMKFDNTLGGSRLATSVGASVIGLGGDCFPAATMISVDSYGGCVDISKIKIGDHVQSFNHSTGLIEKRRVQAIRTKRVSRLVEVTSASGHKVLCTPEHRIFTQEHDYWPAELSQGLRCLILPTPSGLGSSILHSLREVFRKAQMRVRKVLKKGWKRYLLLIEMPDEARQLQEHPQVPVRTAGFIQWLKELLKSVCSYFNKAQSQALSYLQKIISTQTSKATLLLQGVCKPQALQKNERTGQFKLSGIQASLSGSLQEDAGISAREGQSTVRSMLIGQGAVSHPSHQPKKERQPARKSHNLMPCLPSELAPREDGIFSVSTSGDGGSEIEVYDIQVEGNCNFFANGILVHNCLITDDPHSAVEVHSDVMRANVLDWFDQEYSSRVTNPKTSSKVIIMQRLHQGDLSQHVLDKGGWEHLKLPAEYEGDPNPTSIGWVDPRKELGETLWPERFGTKEIEEFRKNMGAMIAAGQLQQRPAPAEGALFKKNWFRYYTEVPKRFDQVVQAWDFAVKDKKTSDYTVGIAIGRIGADKYLLDMTRGRWDFPTACQSLIKFSQRWPQAHKKIIEAKAMGPSVKQTLTKQVSGLVEIEPDGDKIARANSVSPDCEAGNVYLPDPRLWPWVNDFLGELCMFPAGKHDDMVDAFVYALMELRKRPSFFIPILGHGSGHIWA